MAPVAIPLQFRNINPWQNQPRPKLSTEGVSQALDSASASLSLEVVKNIWRKYPKLDTTNAVDVGSSSSGGTNALDLDLGMQSIGATTPNRITTGISRTGHDSTTDEGGALVADSQSVSPTWELAVEELPPLDNDSMDISPVLTNEPLTSDTREESECEPMRSLARDGETDRGRRSIVGGQGDAPPPDGHAVMRDPQFSPPSAFERSQHDSPRHSMDEVRSVLMDSFERTVQLRSPNQVLDREHLREQFSRKLPDSDVRNFLRMGKGIIDQLKRSGKMDEAKRKYASIGGMEVERRLKRHMDKGALPGSREGLYTPDPGSESPRSHLRIHGANSPATTLARSDRSTRDTTPRASTAMLENQSKNTPPLASSNSSSRGLLTPRGDILEREPSLPHLLRDDVSMSVSVTPQQTHDSPHPNRLSPTRSKRGHSGNFKPPDVPLTRHDLNGTEKQFNNESRPREPGSKAGSSASPGVSLLRDVGASKILLAKVGLPSLDLLEASFDVDETLMAAARRWAQRSKYFDSNERHMRLYLLSIPTKAAETAYRELPPNSPPSLLAETVWQIGVSWPSLGTFYVSLNKERTEAKSWGNHFFTASSPPLDISNVVIPGKNHIQFVQLADHSQRLFLVMAIPPSEDEKQKVLARQSHVTTWDHISRDSKNTAPVKLQLALSCNVP